MAFWQAQISKELTVLKNLSSLIISLLFGSGLKEVSVAGGGAGTGVQLLKVGHALSLINFHADKLFSLSFTHTRDTHTHTHTHTHTLSITNSLFTLDLQT